MESLIESRSIKINVIFIPNEFLLWKNISSLKVKYFLLYKRRILGFLTSRQKIGNKSEVASANRNLSHWSRGGKC